MINHEWKRRFTAGLVLLLAVPPIAGLHGLPAAQAAAGSVPIPPLTITEMVQDTTNAVNASGSSVDGFEYIELYNNSSTPIPLKGYKIIYNTTSTWNLDKDMTIQPHDTMILWVQSPGLSGSVEAFNANFGSHIREDQFYPISGQGLSNSGSRTLILVDGNGFQLCSVSYSDGTGENDDVVLNKSVIYSYPTDQTIVMRKTANQQTPTPGSIVAGQAPDTSAPVSPAGLFAVREDRSVRLNWTASADPNVTGYRVIVNGVMEDETASDTSYEVTGLTNFTEYRFSVVAVNADFQMSMPSELVKATPQPEVIDSIPPDAPTGLAASQTGAATVKLNWAPNTEPDIASYNIYRNGSLAGTVSSSTYTADITSLSGGFEYKLQVSAVDSSANESEKSQPLAVTLPHEPLTQEETGAPIVGDITPYQRFLDVSEPGPIVPGLLQGLVPQGMHIIRDKNWAVLSSYRDDRRASTLTIIDLTTGKQVKTIHLYKNGQPFTGHAGGVAVSDKYVWVAYGKELLRLKLDDVVDCPDNANLSFEGSFLTNTRASFATYSDGILWVGDYYSSPNYLTTPIQKMTTRDNKVYNAWIVGYKLDKQTDLLPADSKLTSDGMVIPDYIFSVPDRIQGATVTADEVMLSQTNGNPNSNILKYKASVQEPPHTSVTIENTTVPVWFLDGLNMEDSLNMPPSAEGNFLLDGKLYIMYESGANIYRPEINYPLDRLQIVDLKAWELYDHIAIDAPAAALTEGQTVPLKVRYYLGKQGTNDVTAYSSFVSSDPSVASVESDGLLTALRPGDTVVSATYKGKTAVYSLKVVPDSDATLKAVSLNDEPLAGFAPQTKAYVYRAPHAMSSVTLQAATTAARASLSGITVKRGDTVTDVTYTVSDAVYRTSSVPLPEGDSLFAIGVTAADGRSADSYSVTVNRAALPAAPAELTAAAGTGEALLSWKAAQDPATAGYYVYQDGRRLTEQPITEARYTAKGLAGGIEYRFAVTAVNAFGEQSAQAAVTVKLDDAEQPPVDPGNPSQPGDGGDTGNGGSPGDHGGNPGDTSGGSDDSGDDSDSGSNSGSGGSSGSSGGSGSSAGSGGSAESGTSLPTGGDVTVDLPKPAVDGSGIAAAEVTRAVLEQALAALKAAPQDGSSALVLKLPPLDGAARLTVKLPAAVWNELQASGAVGAIRIQTGLAAVSIRADALGSGHTPASDVVFTIALANAETLPAEVRSAADNKPVYEFGVSVDGKQIHALAGKRPAQITFGYTADGETPSRIVAYYITEAGQLEPVASSRYDAAAGTVSFTAGHFSYYTAMQAPAAFGDLSGAVWAQEAAEALAARGMIDGVGGGRFAPDLNVTREQFVKMLIEALDLADDQAEARFTDVDKDAYYYKYVAAAQKLGITQGYEDGSFGVGRQITRQEMAALAYRASQLAQIKLTPAVPGKAFSDHSDIQSYAAQAIEKLQQAGIMDGMSEGRFAPDDSSTRAQAAKLIYGLYLKGW